MWEDLIKKAKEGGLDVVETYVFWNVHEPSPGNVLSFQQHFIFYLAFYSVYNGGFFTYFLSIFFFQYDFGGRYDLVRFIKTIQKAGLYAHLRIGPYVCAEWNFGYFIFFFSCLFRF